jgi:hypothetical protein
MEPPTHPVRFIQTIRQDLSGSDQIDEAPNLSTPDPSGADQIDVEHQATDLAVPHAVSWAAAQRDGVLVLEITETSDGLTSTPARLGKAKRWPPTWPSPAGCVVGVCRVGWWLACCDAATAAAGPVLASTEQSLGDRQVWPGMGNRRDISASNHRTP